MWGSLTVNESRSYITECHWFLPNSVWISLVESNKSVPESLNLFRSGHVSNDYKSYPHDEGSNDAPRKSPVLVWLPSSHLLNAVGKSGRSEDPSNGDRLEKAAPQDRDAARAVKVHQLKQENHICNLKLKCYIEDPKIGQVQFWNDPN